MPVSVIDDIKTVINLFFNKNLLYLALFLVCFVLLAVNKKCFRGKQLFTVYTLLVLIAIVFNPVFKVLFYRVNLVNDSIFARYWLLCPVWLIITYTLTSVSTEYFKGVVKALVILICSAVIIFAGNASVVSDQFIDSNSEFKINNDAVEISDALLDLSDDQPVSVFIWVKWQGEGNYVHGGTILEGINQYTGLIETNEYYLTDETWNNYYVSEMIPNDIMTSDEYINQSLEYWGQQTEFDYVAWPDDDRIISKMDYCGYELVGHAGGYYIFALSE